MFAQFKQKIAPSDPAPSYFDWVTEWWFLAGLGCLAVVVFIGLVLVVGAVVYTMRTQPPPRPGPGSDV